MKFTFQTTMKACFTGYVVQAVVNNFLPLLFLTFERDYGVPLRQITALITLNFGVQLTVDLLSAFFVDRLGYRFCITAAHVLSAAGMAGLAVLPAVLPPFAGLLICVTLYAVGGGLLEVLVSPILENCPTKNRETAMSLLHGFYCWGQVATVLLSTLFFRVFGTGNWRILALVWALIPAANTFVFLKTPIKPFTVEGGERLSMGMLFKKPSFWFFCVMMLCAGASELAVSQWSSAFAEQGLGVSKTVGDLAGPMLFAVLMGVSRTVFGKWGDRMDLRRFMLVCGVLLAVSYFVIALSPWPALSLAGCGLCGFSVGIMWPGSFSRAAAKLRGGGTALFSLLALFGDLGCTSGPTLVGLATDAAGGNMQTGILAAAVFPVGMLVCLLAAGRKERKRA